MPNYLSQKGIGQTISAAQHTRSFIRNSDDYRKLSADAQAFVDNQLFGSRTIDRRTPMSALEARIHHNKCLHHTVQLAFSDLLGDFPMPILATFSFLDGEVPIGAPLRNSQTSIMAAREALKRHSLEGIIAPDIDLLLLPGAQEPIVAYHLHALVTSTAKRIRLASTARKIAEEIGKPSRLPKSVTLRGKLPGDPRVHAQNIGSYATKIVSALKDASGGPSGEARPQRGRARYRPHHALYGLHAWSQLMVLDAVIPVGEFGKTMHCDWLRRVTRNRDPRVRDVEFTRSSLESGWADVFLQVNKKLCLNTVT